MTGRRASKGPLAGRSGLDEDEARRAEVPVAFPTKADTRADSSRRRPSAGPSLGVTRTHANITWAPLTSSPAAAGGVDRLRADGVRLRAARGDVRARPLGRAHTRPAEARRRALPGVGPERPTRAI